MLILAADAGTCAALWRVEPALGCVWWARKFEQPRPPSLYNTMFSKVALAFFEARKASTPSHPPASHRTATRAEGRVSRSAAAACCCGTPSSALEGAGGAARARLPSQPAPPRRRHRLVRTHAHGSPAARGDACAAPAPPPRGASAAPGSLGSATQRGARRRFANPLPIFKTLYRDHQLIVQALPY
jgi:hypothetical protein